MDMTVQDAIRSVVEGRNLSEQEAFAVASQIMGGQLTDAQVAGLLVGLRMKGETVEEITGFARAMRHKVTPLGLQPDSLVDTCGTGWDCKGTFNISTVSAFVAAGAGCKVAKHGNRSISSKCGSVEVLEALGVATELPPEKTAEAIERIGVGFLFAPLYHKAARHAAGPRREIGVRSIFNILGPLTNPAGAKRQLLGVFDADLTEPMARVLAELGSVHCLVVHGEDGLDEITLTGKTRVSELRHSRIRTYTLEPEELGFECVDLAELRGGEPQANAQTALDVLGGKRGPARDIVVLNAGAAIFVSGRAASLEDGIERAVEAIDVGAALSKLEALQAFGRET